MKLISWNVNASGPVWTRDFWTSSGRRTRTFSASRKPRCSPVRPKWIPPAIISTGTSAERKGYSGTAVFAKREPVSVRYGLGIEEHDKEGRVITLEYPEFWLVTVYTPNSQAELARLDYRCQWEDVFRDYLGQLKAQKPVIVCGDLNVAHKEIDLKNPKSNRGNAGFSDQERGKMTELALQRLYRHLPRLYPDRTGAYTWWSYRFTPGRTTRGGASTTLSYPTACFPG